MPERDDILIQSIVDEAQLTRKQVADIEQRMVSNDDFHDFADDIKTKLGEIKIDQKETNQKIELLHTAEILNTNFRVFLQNLINECKNRLFYIFVAVIGGAGADVVAHFLMKK